VRGTRSGHARFLRPPVALVTEGDITKPKAIGPIIVSVAMALGAPSTRRFFFTVRRVLSGSIIPTFGDRDGL
jgi:hypothetical protein